MSVTWLRIYRFYIQNVNLEEDDMLDTIISGGKVVTPAGPGYWDIGISGEKIVVVAMPGILPTE